MVPNSVNDSSLPPPSLRMPSFSIIILVRRRGTTQTVSIRKNRNCDRRLLGCGTCQYAYFHIVSVYFVRYIIIRSIGAEKSKQDVSEVSIGRLNASRVRAWGKYHLSWTDFAIYRLGSGRHHWHDVRVRIVRTPWCTTLYRCTSIIRYS